MQIHREFVCGHLVHGNDLCSTEAILFGSHFFFSKLDSSIKWCLICWIFYLRSCDPDGPLKIIHGKYTEHPLCSLEDKCPTWRLTSIHLLGFLLITAKARCFGQDGRTLCHLVGRVLGGTGIWVLPLLLRRPFQCVHAPLVPRQTSIALHLCSELLLVRSCSHT